MGAIAASGHPEALHLFRQIILASASIPVAFPPALIEVTTPDGQTYDEVHVDGGATSQVTFVAPSIPIKALTEKALGRNVRRHLYLVMNNELTPPYLPIVAERDEIGFSVGWIPARTRCPSPTETFVRSLCAAFSMAAESSSARASSGATCRPVSRWARPEVAGKLCCARNEHRTPPARCAR